MKHEDVYPLIRVRVIKTSSELDEYAVGDVGFVTQTDPNGAHVRFLTGVMADQMRFVFVEEVEPCDD